MFVVIEGADGCGKTTQVELLIKRLRREGCKCFHVYDPGTTEFGRRARELLLDPELTMQPLTEMLLFSAARSETAYVVRQQLAEGAIVIADRWLPSTVAYQGRQGVPLQTIEMVHRTSCYGVKPDQLLILDVPGAVARSRLVNKGKQRFEQDDDAAFEERRELYRQIPPLLGCRALVLDGELPVETIHQQIYRLVAAELSRRDAALARLA